MPTPGTIRYKFGSRSVPVITSVLKETTPSPNLPTIPPLGAMPGWATCGWTTRNCSNLRGDGIRNLDLSLTKEFTIREGKILQVRAEMFNAFNHQRFAFPDVGSGDGALGTVTSTTNNFRRMQFGARFQF